MKVFTDHAHLVGIERKDLASISNQKVVRLIEKTQGYCYNFHHVRPVKNLFAHCLSRQPLDQAEQAKDVPRFGVSCSARSLFEVGDSIPEHREDVKVIADKGKDCKEYC